MLNPLHRDVIYGLHLEFRSYSVSHHFVHGSLAVSHPHAGMLMRSSCVDGGADGVLETGEGLPLAQDFLTALREVTVKESKASCHILTNQSALVSGLPPSGR